MVTQQKRQEILRLLEMLESASAISSQQIKQTVWLLKLAMDSVEEQSSETTGLVPISSSGPVVDAATFSVTWKGRSCFLGNTLLFGFFSRIAQSANRYVSHQDLLDDVWGGERESVTIRGVVKRLRDRLSAAGMAGLAEAIDGSVSGCYRLKLV